MEGNVEHSNELEKWIISFENEQKAYSSLEYYSQVELPKIFSWSNHLGLPNVYRTGICLYLCHRIFILMDRYHNILPQIFEECIRSIFTQSEDLLISFQSTPIELMKIIKKETYFQQLQHQTTETTRMELTIQQTEKKYESMRNSLLSKQDLLLHTSRRWSILILSVTFRIWKRQVKTRHQQDFLFNRFLIKRQERELSRHFLGWKRWNCSHRLCRLNKMIEKLNQQILTKQTIWEGQIYELQIMRERKKEYEANMKEKQIELEEMTRELKEAKTMYLESEERKHQVFMRKWSKLCMTLITGALHYSKMLLNAIDWRHDLHDLSMLLQPKEQITDLLKLSSDMIVLRWMNAQRKKYNEISMCKDCKERLDHCQCQCKRLKTIQNFSTDLADAQVLLEILSVLQNKTEVVEITGDSEQDAMQAIKIFTSLTPTIHNLLTPSSIIKGTSDLLFAMNAFLFCEHTNALPSMEKWEELSKMIETTENEWHEIFQIWNNGNPEDGNLPSIVDMKTGYVPSSRLRQAKKKLESTMQTVQYLCTNRSIVLQIFNTLRNEVRTVAWSVLLRRKHGTMMRLPDYRLAKQLTAFTTMNEKKIIDTFKKYLPPSFQCADQDLSCITMVSMEHTEILRLTFMKFASYMKDDMQTMSWHDFEYLIKHCNLNLHGGKIGWKDAQRMFLVAKGDQIENFAMYCDQPDKGLSPQEYTEVILYLSIFMQKENSIGCHTLTDIANLFHYCLDEYLARSLPMKNPFFSFVLTQSCKNIFVKHYLHLKELYASRCKGNKLLDYEGFLSILLKEHQILSAVLSIEDLKHIFLHIQDEDINSSFHEISKSNGLVFMEFCHAIAAVAVSTYPNPYSPFHEKVDTFLSHDLTCK